MSLKPFSLPYSADGIDDLKSQLDRLSRFHHYWYDSHGLGIHFLYEPGKGPDPMPLVVTHGWPGSFLEMLAIIPLLTDPAAHGGDASDSFHVVIPSLPGYGFSDRLTKPGMNTFRTAELWVGLMADLGFSRFAAQGGDIGASVTAILGLRHAGRLIGIHLNYIPGSFRPHLPPGTELSAPEQEFLSRATKWRDDSGALFAHAVDASSNGFLRTKRLSRRAGGMDR